MKKAVWCIMQLRANCLGQAVSTMKHHILASSGNYLIPQQIINFSCKNEFTPIATTHEKKNQLPEVWTRLLY